MRQLRVLSEDHIERWRRDGFLSPFPLLDPAELQACRDGLRRFETWLGGRVNGVADLKWRTMPYLFLPWAAKLARGSGSWARWRICSAPIC